MNWQRETTFRALRATLTAACVLAGLSACTSPSASSSTAATPPPPRAFWHGDAVTGSPRIVVNLSEQRARYYKGGELVGETPIASGRAGYPTPTGSFKVTEKDLHHRSSWYGDYVYPDGTVARSDVDVRRGGRPEGSRYVGASMKYFMRINGPVGMHEGYLPGAPASHGCIRLPTQMAAIFFRETPLGTPVQVVGHASNAPHEAPIAIGQNVLGSAPAVAGSVAQEPTAGVPKEEVRKAKPATKRERKSAKKQPPPPRGQTLYLYD